MSLFSTKIRQGKPAAPAQPPLLVVADESQGMRHRLPKWVHTRIQAVLPLSWGPTLPLGFLVSTSAFTLARECDCAALPRGWVGQGNEPRRILREHPPGSAPLMAHRDEFNARTGQTERDR